MNIRRLKKNSGITLIALVITIIVMLILVSVTVTIAVNGGLFEKAGEAVGKTQNAINLEQQLANGSIIDQYLYNISEEIANLPTYSKELLDETTKVLPTNAKYISGNQVAVIPAGFKVSEVAEEQTIANGLVITDAYEDGNEFVWVPCTTTGGSGLIKYAQDKQYNVSPTEAKQYEYNNYTDWTDEGGNASSVEKNGGFYVARYEAGVPSDADFYASNDGDTYYTASTTPGKNVATYKPVSKANNQAWNFISQKNAKTVSAKMYENSTSVQSSLIDSYAWDTIVNWMKRKTPGIATDSTKYGNYVNSVLSCTEVRYASYIMNYDSSWTWKSTPSTYQKGELTVAARTQSGEQNVYELATGNTTSVLNIYDMAGNMWEWTTEVGSHLPTEDGSKEYAVRRGGGFYHHGYDGPVSNRHGAGQSSYTSYSIGFRVVLYIK